MSDDHEHENGDGDSEGEDGHHEPERETFSHDPVGHAEVRAGMTVGELADEYGNAGVGAADLHEAVDVTESMFDDDVTVFFGLADDGLQYVQWATEPTSIRTRTFSG